MRRINMIKEKKEKIVEKNKLKKRVYSYNPTIRVRSDQTSILIRFWTNWTIYVVGPNGLISDKKL